MDPDPDPGGPKTCGSGSGSATLVSTKARDKKRGKAKFLRVNGTTIAKQKEVVLFIKGIKHFAWPNLYLYFG
jgi:hypothetical protein